MLAKHQGIVCNEIHRILKDLAKNPPPPPEKLPASSSSSAAGNMNSPVEALRNEERSLHRRIPSELLNEHAGGTITIPLNRSRSRPRPGLEGETDTLARGISSMSVDSPNAITTNGIRRASISNMDLKDNLDLEIALKGIYLHQNS